MKKMTIEEFYETPFSDLKAPSLLGMSQVVIDDDNILSLVVNTEKNHMNLHGTIQAGIQYLIADTALGMALKHIGRPGVAMDGHIYLYRPGKLGDVLTASVYPRKVGRRTGNFLVEVKRQDGKMVSECAFSVMFNSEGK
ncbi:MAG: hotdog fold thioesterase [Eubacterium sp.]|nr:hotdog fold thioesterase [Eubacterium sp.]